MAKPVRYPRKLRMKLEKIVAERDQREAQAQAGHADPFYGSDGRFDPFRNFYRAFHRPDSVEVMHGRLDDTGARMSIRYRLKARFRDLAVAKAPWTEPDASS
jgi:hypothetical protein